ncbi:isochorismatase family protein [Streptomyces sp. NPDC091204]|uniref:isochorismatase family protein n=1 Tax=Streptomyces sp. NPDC091204 TaxID=3155299 RepID=UPI0034366CA6
METSKPEPGTTPGTALVLIDLMPHERLLGLGVERLVLAGLVTTMGVESTARAASDHGYEVEFVEDAMSAFAADEHEFAVRRIFPRFGEVRDTASYLKSLPTERG